MDGEGAAPTGRPLPFIYPSRDDPSRFELGAEALALLESIRADAVAPVAVAGR
jgi:hypothetical protein